MSWFYWPEFIVTIVCTVLLLFAIYYSVRKWFSIPRRLKKLESTVYKKQSGAQ
ncbi:hypothetical protein PA598K_05255 [Paenibacillus sp. 598K]|nr:hypothetical protein PA598K_05255 [Paenibacillus sp. 598K]